MNCFLWKKWTQQPWKTWRKHKKVLCFTLLHCDRKEGENLSARGSPLLGLLNSGQIIHSGYFLRSTEIVSIPVFCNMRLKKQDPTGHLTITEFSALARCDPLGSREKKIWHYLQNIFSLAELQDNKPSCWCKKLSSI